MRFEISLFSQAYSIYLHEDNETDQNIGGNTYYKKVTSVAIQF